MILIDFSPISIAAAMMISEQDFSEDMYRHMVINSILHLRKKFKKYGETVIVFDDRNYWRKDIFPMYKGHRAAARAASTFDFKTFFKYQETVKEELSKIFPYRWIQIPRCEADDVIGHLALTAKTPTVIISPDGDFKQCMRNPNVSLYSNIKKRLEPANTLYEVEVELHRKIMKGDSGDNINNVFHALDETPKRQKSITERLLTHTFEHGLGSDLKLRYAENQQLIDLRCIPEKLKEQISESLNNPIEGSKARIWNYLTSKRLNRIGSFLKDIEDFV